MIGVVMFLALLLGAGCDNSANAVDPQVAQKPVEIMA
jgi:hypothetical protein